MNLPTRPLSELIAELEQFNKGKSRAPTVRMPRKLIRELLDALRWEEFMNNLKPPSDADVYYNS